MTLIIFLPSTWKTRHLQMSFLVFPFFCHNYNILWMPNGNESQCSSSQYILLSKRQFKKMLFSINWFTCTRSLIKIEWAFVLIFVLFYLFSLISTAFKKKNPANSLLSRLLRLADFYHQKVRLNYSTIYYLIFDV